METRKTSANHHSGHEIITRSKSRQIALEIFRSIPQDIISKEILTRLPVKSLLRFKCVSRYWHFIISSKVFGKRHMELSANKNLTEHNVTLVSTTSQGYALLHCLGRSMFSRSYMKIDHFETYRTGYDHAPIIIGCYNGLCCLLMNGDQFAIANPFTKESRGLPNTFFKELARVIIYGFGYDEANNDYKVLAVLKTHLSPPQQLIRLYSLKADSWKTIDNFFGHDTYNEGRGEFFNGKLHWMSENLKIVSFDIRTEAAGVFEPPSSAEHFFRKMGAIKGCLALTCDKPNEGTEVWAMKEYGVKESWCRVMVVPYFGTFLDNPFNYPLFISENGIVVLDVVDNRSILYIYNPKSGLVKRIRLKVNETCQLDFYIQSLVSPFRHAW